MDRRIYGLETEFGIAYSDPAGRQLAPEEIARFLFRSVVQWGRSSNVFLSNGARLYLDVGSHPEYASAECDSLVDLILQDRAGERIVQGLVDSAQERMASEGYRGKVYVFKNNTDSAGNSYGSHENYLIPRKLEFARLTESLVPFLVSRQILVGAGKVLDTPHGHIYAFTQRADHMWEGVSSSTTRSRPIINTRDEPHADAEYYRRLHVISGDSNMSEVTTRLKVGTVDLLLRILEAGTIMPDFKLENPIRSIRDVSHDLTGTAPIRLANGKSTTALDLQSAYLEIARGFVEKNGAHHEYMAEIFDLWERTIAAVASGDYSGIDTEIDWAIKKKLIDRYMQRHGLGLDAARVAQLDLTYHDLAEGRGLFQLVESRGQAKRLCAPEAVEAARSEPPQTTRARLRGRFVEAARRAHRDFTVDWVHLKLNDRAHHTLLCKDPFLAEDERVDAMIEALNALGQ